MIDRMCLIFRLKALGLSSMLKNRGPRERSGDHGVPATTPGPPRRGLCAVGWDGVGGSAGAEPPGSLEAFGYKLLAPGLSRGFGSPAGPPQGHEGKTT